MKRENFVDIVEDSLDSLPEEFRSRIKNVAILVEDFPLKQSPPLPGQQRRLLLGIFHGVPATNKSIFATSCFTKRTSKPSVRARQKSASKSGKRSYTNWGTISA
jgi:predicted Zn-dependent protease with MMP-like domain